MSPAPGCAACSPGWPWTPGTRSAPARSSTQCGMSIRLAIRRTLCSLWCPGCADRLATPMRCSRQRPAIGWWPTPVTWTCTNSNGWLRTARPRCAEATRRPPSRCCGALSRCGAGRRWRTAQTPRSPPRRSLGWTICGSLRWPIGWRLTWRFSGRAAVVAELEALTREHPLDERFAALLIKALRAEGRTSEALAAYQRLRQLLVDELGVDPHAGAAGTAPVRSARRPGSAQQHGRICPADQPAGDSHQLRRPRRGGGAHRQIAGREPPGHAGRNRRLRQDPPRHRGRIVAPGRLRRHLARRARSCDGSGRDPLRGPGLDRPAGRHDAQRSGRAPPSVGSGRRAARGAHCPPGDARGRQLRTSARRRAPNSSTRCWPTARSWLCSRPAANRLRSLARR